MLYIAQNLRFLRKQKQISQAALAKQIGVVPGTISNYENGASEPDFEHLEMIIKILDVSAHDLLYTNLESERDFKTKGAKILIKENDKDFDKERKLQNSLSNGEGEIFKTKGIENVTLSKGDVKGDKKGDKRKLPKTSPFDEGEVRQSEAFRNATPVIYDMPEMLSVVKEPETPYNENAVCVPVVHIEAAAGGGAFNVDFNEDVDTMMLPKSFLPKTSCMRYCIDIRGESMEPTLLDKTRIVVRLLDRSDWVGVRSGNVYVVTDREGLTYVKRIRNRLKARGVLVLTSDNPDQDRYHSFELEESEIQHIWAVELYISDHIPPMAQRFDGMRAELDALRDRLDEMELRMQ